MNILKINKLNSGTFSNRKNDCQRYTVNIYCLEFKNNHQGIKSYGLMIQEATPLLHRSSYGQYP